jgi:copper transport protein
VVRPGAGAARARGRRRVGWLILALAFLWPPTAASAAPAGVVVVHSTPAAGSRVGAAPHTVALEFASAVEAPTVQVFGPGGRRIDLDGTAEVTRGGAAVSVTVEDAGSGGYLVAWSATPTGGDGRGPSTPVGGALTFAVGRVPGWTTGPIGGLLTPSGSSGGLAAAVEIAGGLALAALVVLVGLVLAREIRWAPRSWWEDPVVVVASAVVLSGTGVVLFLHGAFAAGLPAGEALSRSTARLTLHSDWGVGGMLALAGVVLVGLLSGRLFPVPSALGPADAPTMGSPTGPSRLAALAVVTLLAAAAVTEGHAVSGRMPVIWSAVAAVHVAAAMVLAALLVLRLGPPGPVTPDRAARLTAVPRLRLAAVVTVVTGLMLAGRETGSVSAVAHTAYGQIVVLKALLSVGLLLAVYAMSDQPTGARTRVRGVSSRLPESAAALLLVSTLVTAVLVFQTPARDAVPRPSTGSITADGVDLEYQLTPARIGANDIHVYVLDQAGAPLAIPEASADLRWPAARADPLPIALRLAGPGHFLDYGVEVPFAGTWTLDVSVELPGSGSRTFASAVTVH